ncbi:MAG TPA: FliH/SctL family protein [Vicinamibacterales bacterium]|nr:FliH/SctL family protein [Vicinamibacterales bacterium]
MSSRARRLATNSDARPFDWMASHAAPPPPRVEPPAIEPDLRPQQANLANLERDAFAKGYEQGERAGLQAGGERAEAMLRRLSQTLEELAALRREMIRQTERQMVQLALAIAKRIVRREIALDRDLTQAMVRLALDRLGDSTTVTVRLHPDDFEAVGSGADRWERSHLSVVADRDVSRGGCLVESDFGFIDGSIEAQFQELARSLLAEEGQEGAVVTHGR